MLTSSIYSALRNENCTFHHLRWSTTCGTQNCLLVIHFAQFWPLRQLTLPASPTGRGRVPCPPSELKLARRIGFALPYRYCAVRIDAYPTVLSFSVLRFQLSTQYIINAKRSETCHLQLAICHLYNQREAFLNFEFCILNFAFVQSTYQRSWTCHLPLIL